MEAEQKTFKRPKWHKHVYAGVPAPPPKKSTRPAWTLEAARKRLAKKPIRLPAHLDKGVQSGD